MIVVTTPSGTVGSEVVRLLMASQPTLPFCAATRNPDKIKQQYGFQINAVAFDFEQPATWPAALEDIQILFLVVPTPQPKLIRERILPFIDAAVQAGCQHIVYQSVPGAGRQKFLPHYQVERHIETTGVSYTFLRPSYFMQNLCGKSSTHGVDIAIYREIFIPAGKGAISFVDTRDVAAAIVKVFTTPLAHKNQSYLLTGPQSLDFYAVAEIFSQTLGSPVHYTRPSLPRFWLRLKKRGVSTGLLLFMLAEYTFIRLGHAAFLTDQLSALLGRPVTSMELFVKENRMRWETQAWV